MERSPDDRAQELARALARIRPELDGDPLPIDVDRISPDTSVGEVVMKQQITPFLQAAKDKGRRIQVGTDMLFEQIPAYLEFFGFGTANPEELRAVSTIKN
jgi:shikimate dehydrogenase